jgi:UDP-N-acetylmuramoylalanine--D-glutamate ligase
MALDTRPEMSDSLLARQAVGAETQLHFGDIDRSVLDGITELVVSPGVALEHPLVQYAIDNDVRVIGDIDLFVAASSAPVIGITGSNGKSTVTALLASMISACGRHVAVGGNFGTPALDLLEQAADFYVLELSSFQLERAKSLNLAVATVLNLSADHLDRHGSLPRYHNAKHKIFQGASAVVANRADSFTLPLLEGGTQQVLWRPAEPDLQEFGVRDFDGTPHICRGFTPLLPISELKLKGGHNLNNVLAALALGTAVDLPMEGLVEGLKQFSGLPHRCELVLDNAGVTWINDSKGTNVGATRAALAGLGGQQNVVLIAGGVGKGQDFTALLPEVRENCRRVLTLGESAREIELALGAHTPVQRVESIEDAVAKAALLAQPGDVVLLSPACASFDLYSGFEARGEAFREAVLGNVEQTS